MLCYVWTIKEIARESGRWYVADWGQNVKDGGLLVSLLGGPSGTVVGFPIRGNL
jgi:hypothetical protein